MSEKIRLRAQRIGYSSVVGGGLTLVEPKGRYAFIVSIMGTTQGITKKENDELVDQLLAAIEQRPLFVSPREE